MLPLLAGLAGSAFGLSAIQAAGLAAGIGALTNREDPVGGAIMGGISGYGGLNLGDALKGAGAAGATAVVPEASLANVGASNIPNTLGIETLSNAGASSLPNPLIPASTAAPQMGVQGSLAAMGRGIANLPTAEGFDAFKTALGEPGKPATTGQAAMAIGMPALNVAGSMGLFDPEYASPEEDDEEKPLYLYGPNSSPALKLYANGGTIQQGGLMDLYGTNDSQYGPPISQQGYGIGRLNNLAGQASQAKAEMGMYAQGGTPKLEDGGFVVPADVVFYVGGHDTEEGQAKLAKKYGATPIRGGGNGLSDGIKTTIEGREPARVADGEAYIPRAVVERHGGPEKFYKMMDRVRKQATGSTKQARKATV